MKELTYKALLSAIICTNLNITECWCADTNTTTAPVKRVIEGNVQKKNVTAAPKRVIDYGQGAKKHSSNNFQDISVSMPAAAVKENLARKHELPNAQTAVLRPGGSVGSAASATNSAGSANSSGSSPEILSPNGVALPEPKGATKNNFYK